MNDQNKGDLEITLSTDERNQSNWTYLKTQAPIIYIQMHSPPYEDSNCPLQPLSLPELNFGEKKILQNMHMF